MLNTFMVVGFGWYKASVVASVCVIGYAGYVGSARWQAFHHAGWRGTGVDMGWWSPVTSVGDYGRLQVKDFQDVDVIVVLAGHSSIAMGQTDPVGTFQNNVMNLVRLFQILDPVRHCVIYASSASVYWGCPFVATEHDWGTAHDPYTSSKACVDTLVPGYWSGRWYGMRFGTVCGVSPHLRTDTVINAMVQTGRDHGEIHVSSPGMWRRKLQIQSRIPATDRQQGYGHHHFQTWESLEQLYCRHVDQAYDLRRYAGFRDNSESCIIRGRNTNGE